MKLAHNKWYEYIKYRNRLDFKIINLYMQISNMKTQFTI
jgi:hypothetical protein